MIRLLIDFSENECPWDPRLGCRLSLFVGRDSMPLSVGTPSFDNGTSEAAIRLLLLDARLQSVR